MARQERKYHYIYKITCKVTNRYYIGMHSTDNLEDGYFGSGKRLWFSLNYHGKENHEKEILEFCNTRAELKAKEKELVTPDLIKEDLCMNLQEGGGGGLVNEEHRKKFIKAGFDNFNKTKEKRLNSLRITMQTNSFKENMSKAKKLFFEKNDAVFLGEKHSEESKQKMRESSKGKGLGETNSQYRTCWITKDGLNKKIKKEDFDIWFNDGWIKGRKTK